MTARRTMLLMAVIALACAGLGLWLGTTITDDAGTVAVVVAACAVLGSFAPTTVRWLRSARRRPH
ncbi:MAG: hypothetical protein ACRDNZ_08115 [Streptosporangiaceae bacterium]